MIPNEDILKDIADCYAHLRRLPFSGTPEADAIRCLADAISKLCTPIMVTPAKKPLARSTYG